MRRTAFWLSALLGVITMIAGFAPTGIAQNGGSSGLQAQASPTQTSQAPGSQTKALQPARTPGTQAPALKGFPFTNESLSYAVTWPSGLSFGEGHMTATNDPAGWKFDLTLDAGIPAFAVKDSYHAVADGDYCSESISKDSVHGSRETHETTTIDRSTDMATRHSTVVGVATGKDGGTSKFSVPDCVHDALTFLYFARLELGQGRVPPTAEVIFGATYDISLVYTGPETIKVGDRSILTDKVACHVKGPASDILFDAYFDRDAARTPVAIRVPLPVGKISLELVR